MLRDTDNESSSEERRITTTPVNLLTAISSPKRLSLVCNTTLPRDWLHQINSYDRFGSLTEYQNDVNLPCAGYIIVRG